MPASLRFIVRRRKSVANTRKITRAMELVAAAKMRKAVQAATAARAYVELAAGMVRRVRRASRELSHPLLEANGSERALLVVVTSQRGLCGAYNAQILKAAAAFVRSRPSGAVEAVVVGRRGEAAMRRLGVPIVASFEAPSEADAAALAGPVGAFVRDAFLAKRFGAVSLLFSAYKGAMLQVPTVQTLLPLASSEAADADRVPADVSRYEPSPAAVLDALLPRLLRAQAAQALLEAAASEHAARMVAMRAASDNAADMIEDLTLTYNQARQAGITQEISEISAGKAALASV
jgi:F-type H+-transporting ATPase subunit gamma